MRVQDLYSTVTKALRSGGALSLKPNIELEANWIVEHYTELNFLDRVRDPAKEISEIAANKAIEAAQRCLAGEPLAYILGYKEFFGLKFQVNSNVLIPRPETELLVEWGLEWLQDHTTVMDETRVLELGTGSGCIATALVKHFKGLRVVAVEKSPGALVVAKANAYAHGAQNHIEFLNIDAANVAQELNGQSFDLILANPPYIDPNDTEIEASVRDYEPAEALFAMGGLSAVQSWLHAAAPLLKNHSALGFEIGARQGADALKLVRDLNVFSKQYVLQDLSGRDRFVCGEK